jgi:hypothetical protein
MLTSTGISSLTFLHAEINDSNARTREVALRFLITMNIFFIICEFANQIKILALKIAIL